MMIKPRHTKYRTHPARGAARCALAFFVIFGFASAGLYPHAFAQSQKKTPPKAKAQKPKADYGKYNFEFTTLEGKKISLSDYAGKTVLVNIWAPWCGPCRKEAPGFLKLFEEYHAKGFEILSIAVQTNETDVRTFMSKYPMKWPVGISDQVAINYRTYGLPDNYVFKPDGSIAKHFIGFTSEEALKQVLEGLYPAKK